MSEIRIQCPNCRTAGNVAESYAGKTVVCPKCQARIDIPSLQESPVFMPVEQAQPAASVPQILPSSPTAATAVSAPPVSLRFCGQCGTTVSVGVRFCGECGADQAQPGAATPPSPTPISSPTPIPTATPSAPSPASRDTISIPNEIKGWNWGACGLAPFWLWSMGLQSMFWVLIGAYILSLIITHDLRQYLTYGLFGFYFYLGSKGNELAWTTGKRQWESAQQYTATQAAWQPWGIGALALAGMVIVVTLVKLL